MKGSETVLALMDGTFMAIRRYFGAHGRFVATRPRAVIIASVVVVLVGMVGLTMRTTETRAEELYIPQNSKSVREADRWEAAFGAAPRFNDLTVAVAASPGDNVLTSAGLADVAALHDRLTTMTVDADGAAVGWEAVCQRYAGPEDDCALNHILALWDYDADAAVADPDPIGTVNAYAATGDRATVDLAYMLGGVTVDEVTGEITAVAALRLTYETTAAKEVDDVVRRWEAAFIDAAASPDDRGVTYPTVAVTRNAARSLEDELDEATGTDLFLVSLSFVMMNIYVGAVNHGFHRVYSQANLACFGVFTVFLAVVTAFGAAAAFGIPFIAPVGFVPFLVLGVGVDDMFIILDCLRTVPALASPTLADRFEHAFREAGPTILLTTVTDLIAFAVGGASIFPAIQYFCAYAGLAIAFVFIFQTTIFAAAVVFDLRRQMEGRLEAAPCIVRPADGVDIVPGKSIADLGENSAAGFKYRAMRMYGNFLIRPPVKAAVVLVFVGYFIFSAAMVTEVDQGLDLRDLTPKNSYVDDHLDAVDAYFNQIGPEFYVFVGEEDYTATAVQDAILDLRAALDESKWVLPSAGSADRAAAAGVVDADSFSSWLETYLAWAAANPPDPDGLDPETGRPRAEVFYPWLNIFLFATGGQYEYFVEDLVCVIDPTAGCVAVTASYVRSRFVPLLDGNDEADAMVSVKKKANSVGIDSAFAYYGGFIYFEQHIATPPQTIRNLALTAVAVTVVGIVFLGHPNAALITFVAVVMIDVDLFSLMALWDVPFDSIAMISLVMAIGFTVDYASHVVYAFMAASGSRDDRIVTALATVGTSVLNGGLTTILGVLTLSGTSSALFQSFFKMFFGIVTFGLAHGLVFVPVVLSLVGPSRLSATTTGPSALKLGAKAPLLDAAASVPPTLYSIN